MILITILLLQAQSASATPCDTELRSIFSDLTHIYRTAINTTVDSKVNMAAGFEEIHEKKDFRTCTQTQGEEQKTACKNIDTRIEALFINNENSITGHQYNLINTADGGEERIREIAQNCNSSDELTEATIEAYRKQELYASYTFAASRIVAASMSDVIAKLFTDLKCDQADLADRYDCVISNSETYYLDLALSYEPVRDEALKALKEIEENNNTRSLYKP